MVQRILEHAHRTRIFNCWILVARKHASCNAYTCQRAGKLHCTPLQRLCSVTGNSFKSTFTTTSSWSTFLSSIFRDRLIRHLSVANYKTSTASCENIQVLLFLIIMQYISLLVHLVVKELIRRKQTWTESEENLYNFFLFFRPKKDQTFRSLTGRKPYKKN